ncbi:DMT family transporter [Rheinheimera mesophila]|uniref:DMT family transporter n=2 Tax=Rheinheimera mesophila TaxID=1547515 RepID=A0A3P3QN85_9GAMM|nr:DMT family transporter [Rheinheimera mesophila]KKL01497.1 membrane protein [Rheinheimera mesophila]RRJ22686.1 DMT family transporter [Rheinheimera mesophila]
MHQSSGRVGLGFSLALLTAVLWGLLPIALKWLLNSMSAATITWIRFVAAAGLVGLVLLARRQLPSFRGLSVKKKLLIVLAIAGLLLNYILYLKGLFLLTAETAQVVIQLAPFLMMLGAVYLFKERLLFWQKVGAWLLLIGLVLFFNDRLALLLTQFGSEAVGVLLVIIAAIAWACYALAQKQLLLSFNSQQIMWLIYVAGALCFLPSADLAPLAHLSAWQWGIVLFCCLNTIVAYGAFAEALQHWQAANVSAVLAITPLLTIGFAQLLAYFYPQFPSESLNVWAWVGASLVVIGSMLTALAPMLKNRL